MLSYLAGGFTSYLWSCLLDPLQISPLAVQSLKEACVRKLEGFILSGELKIGERLPAERALAQRLGLSRPVLHEALVDLAGKGLVVIEPRRGARIADFRTSGSLALLPSLLAYQEGALDPVFMNSLMEMRLVLEMETARLAAERRTPEQLERLQAHLRREAAADWSDAQTLTALDFEFHLLVAIASNNVLYPMILNSFEKVYTNLTGRFFAGVRGGAAVGEVWAFHAQLRQAVKEQNSPRAAEIMAAMLRHGEAYLRMASAMGQD